MYTALTVSTSADPKGSSYFLHVLIPTSGQAAGQPGKQWGSEAGTKCEEEMAHQTVERDKEDRPGERIELADQLAATLRLAGDITARGRAR